MQVAVIGLGRIGSRLARHLDAAGFLRAVHSRSPAQLALPSDVRQAASPAEACRGVEGVLLSLPSAKESRAVLEGPAGILGQARPGFCVLDATTMSHAESRGLAAACARQ